MRDKLEIEMVGFGRLQTRQAGKEVHLRAKELVAMRLCLAFGHGLLRSHDRQVTTEGLAVGLTGMCSGS